MKYSNENILDCTLRDGGYYNNWNYSKKFIQKYLNQISLTVIKYIELGFRLNDKDKIKSHTAYTDKKLLNNLKVSKPIKIGVMINVDDLISKYKFDTNILKIYSFKKN